MKKHIVLATVFLSALFIVQCKKKPTEDDKAFFQKAINTSGFTYYKNDDTIQPSSSGSGHPSYFRVRFNATAYAALTDGGKLPTGGSFPEGSIVVKEIYNDAAGTSMNAIAIMEKSSNNSLQGNGWVWGEYFPDGSLGYSVSNNGTLCTNCHNQGSPRDQVRLFEFFP